MKAGYEKAISELKDGKIECSPIMKEFIDRLFATGNVFNFGFGPKDIKQEQPDFDDVDPKHLVHSHYTKVRETKTGRVFWAEYSSEAAEWYEAGTGKAYSISDVEIVKEQPEVELKKEIDVEWAKCEPIDEGMGLESANIVNEQFDAIARHFYELGLNARKEE